MIPLLRQYLFLTPLLVLALCEVTKMGVSRLRNRREKLRVFLPGGFPSTHSAFVTSMLIVVGHKTSIESPVFVIAFCLAAITWYDSIFVRHELGIQAHILNRLQHWEHLRERLGHTLTEVIGGIGFGAVITTAGIALV